MQHFFLFWHSMFNVWCIVYKNVLFFIESFFCRIFLRSYFCLHSRCLLLLLPLEAHTKKEEDEKNQAKQTNNRKKRTHIRELRTVYHAHGLIWLGLLFCKLCKYIQSVCTWQKEFVFFFTLRRQINVSNIGFKEWNRRNKSKCCYQCNGKSLTMHYHITLTLNFYLIMPNKLSHQLSVSILFFTSTS